MSKLAVLYDEGKAEEIRRRLPEVASKLTQLTVDNPGTVTLIVCGSMVATRAAMNIVRPRNALEALALLAVLQVGLPLLAIKAAERGWITIKIRDENGCRVPLEISGA